MPSTKSKASVATSSPVHMSVIRSIRYWRGAKMGALLLPSFSLRDRSTGSTCKWDRLCRTATLIHCEIHIRSPAYCNPSAPRHKSLCNHYARSLQSYRLIARLEMATISDLASTLWLQQIKEAAAGANTALERLAHQVVLTATGWAAQTHTSTSAQRWHERWIDRLAVRGRGAREGVATTALM